MTRMTRRDFLKLAGLGTTALASISSLTLLEGALRHGWRGKESSQAQRSIATACPGCPAGCGWIVQTAGNQVMAITGNPAHPLNCCTACPDGQAALAALHSNERAKGPLKQSGRGAGTFEPVSWGAATAVLSQTFQKYQPGEIAFLMGVFPDHLYDLVQALSGRLGGMRVLRFGLSSELEGRVTLLDAARRLFGVPKIPYFDLGHAEVIFSFGASFGETWLAPGYVQRRPERQANGRGYWVQFESYRSQVATEADEWIPIQPGSEGVLAQALARLIIEKISGEATGSLARLDLPAAAKACGVSIEELKRLAGLFASASPGLAIPGSVSLGGLQSLTTAETILALNLLVNNLGKAGGLFLTPDLPGLTCSKGRPATLAEVGALIERIRSGAIKALFVHGVDPLRELPRALGVAEALEQLELLVSFSPLLDRTAAQADYILPDHMPLESWGYQRVSSASGRLAVSAIQPVIAPLYETRSTANLLLQAAHAAGGHPQAILEFRDELDFLQRSAAALTNHAINTSESWELWLQQGGWWTAEPVLVPPVSILPPERVFSGQLIGTPGIRDENGLLCLYPTGALRLRQRMSPLSAPRRVVIHPRSAAEIGLQSGQVVEVASTAGKLIAIVDESETIVPGAVAIPSEYPPSDLGDQANRLNTRPLDLLEHKENESGSLAFMATRVQLTFSS